jgi:hypothetical protein
MTRPAGYQWQPLGLNADPIPGDPAAISQEAAHLASIAKTLAGQITALQKIAADGTEVGQHAETIRTTARSLVTSLQAVATRYGKVSSALSAWVPELEQAQAMSVRALDQAEIPYAQLTRQVALPSGPNLTAAQKQEISQRQATVQSAQEQFDDAKAVLTRAITLRDTQGDYYAAKINQASNDSLTDHGGWFSDITGFLEDPLGYIDSAVKDSAWFLKDVCTVLEFVATALAIAALCFTGVGWLLLAAFIMTGTALFFRTLLAVTGNGSWVDVAVDAFALSTLGIGGGVSGVGGLVGRAGRTLDEAVDLGDQIANADRAASFSGRVSSFFSRVADSVEDSRFLPKALAKPFALVSREFSDFNAGMRPLASEMIKDVEETSAWSRIFAGGEEPATYAAKMRMLLARFPDSPDITQLGARFSKDIWMLRGVVGTGTAVTSTATGASGVLPIVRPDGQPWQAYHVPAWEHLEDATTHPLHMTTVERAFELVHSSFGD